MAAGKIPRKARDLMLNAGSLLGPYEIVGPLGAGGMGEVYKAHDTRLGREVAIKVLPAEYSADEDRLRRFEQEARAVGQLSHPNILTVFEWGRTEGLRTSSPSFWRGHGVLSAPPPDAASVFLGR